MRKNVLLLFLLGLQAALAQDYMLMGKVVDAEREPLFGANVTIDSRNTGAQTDMNGDYRIAVREGDIIRFSYLGLQTVRVKVQGQNNVFVQLVEDQAQLDPVVVSYSGIPKARKKAPYAITTIDRTEVENKPEPDLLRSLAGKVPGARIIATSGASGAGTSMIIRGQNSITGNNQPLIVVDGVPFNNSTNNLGVLGGGGIVTTNRILDLDPNNIAKVQVLKGLSATILYGQLGRNGVILITTKTGYYGDARDLALGPYRDAAQAEQEEVRQALASERTAKEVGYKSRYENIIRYLAGEADRLDTFSKYLPRFGEDPQFYMDVYDRFEKVDTVFAQKVLESAASLQSEDTPALRALAFKLEGEGRFGHAARLYSRILKKEPASFQTRRHLALALISSGREAEGLDQLAALYTELPESNRELRTILKRDLLQQLYRSGTDPGSYGFSAVDLDEAIHDLRVVVDWNRESVDLDLQLIDPDLEIASVMTPQTNSGGELTSNSQNGQGPESYAHKGYLPGSYYLKIAYTTRETMQNPNGLYVKLDIYRKVGDQEVRREVKVIRLAGKTKLELIDRIAIL